MQRPTDRVGEPWWAGGTWRGPEQSSRRDGAAAVPGPEKLRAVRDGPGGGGRGPRGVWGGKVAGLRRGRIHRGGPAGAGFSRRGTRPPAQGWKDSRSVCGWRGTEHAGNGGEGSSVEEEPGGAGEGRGLGSGGPEAQGGGREPGQEGAPTKGAGPPPEALEAVGPGCKDFAVTAQNRVTHWAADVGRGFPACPCFPAPSRPWVRGASRASRGRAPAVGERVRHLGPAWGPAPRVLAPARARPCARPPTRTCLASASES